MSQLAINWTVPAEDRGRVSKQCLAILEWLKCRPLTNVEAVTDLRVLNLTARISELRQAGHKIPAPVRVGGGVFRYTLGAP